MSLIKVNKNENPYHIIGDYIEKHITCVDDIIAVISLDGNIINELFLTEITTESNFIWQRDWWEGEESIELVDFFFVSDACKRCDNNDLISRQAALDYFVINVGFHDEDGYPIEDTDELRKIWTEYFDGIPSAQPEKRTEKHTETHGVCLDAISRQDAIDVFYELWGTSLTRTVDAIKQLPPAQPKMGRWISLDDFRGKHNENGYKCSVCGEHSDYEENFCPNCGAKMEGEQDG